MNNVIGTCSLCGGAVTTPQLWHGVLPPVPSCSSCGATKKQPHGPVVEMERRSSSSMEEAFRKVRQQVERDKSCMPPSIFERMGEQRLAPPATPIQSGPWCAGEGLQ